MLYRLWIEVVQVEGVRGVWKVLSSSQDGQAAWQRGWRARRGGRRKLACRNRLGLTVWGGGCRVGTDGRPRSGVG